MAQWHKSELPLRPDHAWKALPGCKVFVADRGAVRLDIPEDWILLPTETGSIRFHDRKPPADSFRLELSVLHLNPQVDWPATGLPLVELLEDLQSEKDADDIHKGSVEELKRPGLHLAWAENHYRDPEDGRLIHSRVGIGHHKLVQVILTFDYYASLAWKGSAIWADLIKSMVLDQKIDDPTRGDARHIDN